jgi:hypothetical protein
MGGPDLIQIRKRQGKAELDPARVFSHDVDFRAQVTAWLFNKRQNIVKRI